MLHDRFKFNLRFKTVGEVFSRICALLLYAAGARLLGAEGFGVFSLAFSYAMLSAVLIDSGLFSIVTRMLARDKSNAPELIRTVTTYKFIVSPFAVLLIYLVVRHLDPGGQTAPLIFVTGLVAVATALTDHLSSILSGLERMDIEAWVKSTNKLASVIFAVLLFRIDRSVHGFTLGMALGLFLSLACGFWWVHRNLVPLRFEIDRVILKKVLRVGLPIFLATILVTFYTNQDRYLLSFLHFSDRDIGIYSAAAKLVDALRPLPVLLMGAVYPILSEASVKDRVLFEKISGALVKYSVLALFPFAFGVTVFSRLVVRIVFGPEFVQSGPILQVAIWAFVGIFLNHLFFVFLLSTDRQRRFFQSALVLTLANGLLCFLFFQWFGPIGGGWALVGGEIALFLFNMTDRQNGWLRRGIGPLFLRPALLAGLSVGIYVFLRIWMPDPVAWLLAIGVYGFMIWRLKMVDVALVRKFVV